MTNMKEVYFDQYCPTCANKDVNEADEPCNECLENPCMEDSHKPMNYKEEE